MKIGLKPAEYDEITPYELEIMVEVYTKNQKELEQRMLTEAYMTAVWVRCKKMPSINKVLGIETKKKEMTPNEILDEVKRLNESMGGTTY